MQNHLTKQATVHTASSLLFLLAVSCRLEVELESILVLTTQTNFGFIPEHLDMLLLIDVHLYILAHFVKTTVIPSINHNIPKPLGAEPGTFVELQIVEKIKCRHTPFLKDMSPFITYVFS